MALVTRVKSPDWAAGDVLTAADLKAEFNNLINALNGSNDAKVINLELTGAGTFLNIGFTNATATNVVATSNLIANTVVANTVVANVDMNTVNANASALLIVANVDVAKALVPIGSIIPHYDFNGNLTAKIDTTYWACCNGQSKTINAVSETLPDLSGRYLVGFGTDGGTDNDDATWNVTAVGAVSHEIDLSHAHTLSGNTNSVVAVSSATFNHTHTVATPSNGWNTHTPALSGEMWAAVTGQGGGWYGTTGNTLTSSSPNTSTVTTSSNHSHNLVGSGSMNTQLSTTQSIQPRSIRTRYWMRIK